MGLNLVKFNKRFTSKTFVAANADANTLYFLSDTKEIYLGGVCMGRGAAVTSVNGKTGQTITLSYTDVNALPNTTVYAAGASQNGAAVSANKVNAVLKVGSKTFDGSSEVTITASDLGLGNALRFIGVSTTNPKGDDGATVSTGNGTTDEAEKGRVYKIGDVVIYNHKEFVLVGEENTKDNWVELGDESSYALKATTLEGYGITDAYTKEEVDNRVADATGVNTLRMANRSAEHDAPTISTEAAKGDIVLGDAAIKMVAPDDGVVSVNSYDAQLVTGAGAKNIARNAVLSGISGLDSSHTVTTGKVITKVDIVDGKLNSCTDGNMDSQYADFKYQEKDKDGQTVSNVQAELLNVLKSLTWDEDTVYA